MAFLAARRLIAPIVLCLFALRADGLQKGFSQSGPSAGRQPGVPEVQPQQESQQQQQQQQQPPQPQLQNMETPNWRDVKIHFVSMNSEGPLALKAAGFPAKVADAGSTSRWNGYGSKLIQALSFAAGVPEDEILVYVDGNDVVWGGCSKDVLLNRYRKIIAASGAKVVMGAELVCGEQDCNKQGGSATLPSWLSQSLLAQGASTVATECYNVKANCRCDMPSPPPCRNFTYRGADDDGWSAAPHADPRGSAAASDLQQERATRQKMTFRYMNSGFIMGAAGDVREMLQWAVFHYMPIKGNRSWIHDQGALAAYWKKNPKLVTLDHAGALSLSLPRVAFNTLRLAKNEVTGHQVLRNKLLKDDVQCFIHNNVNEWNGGTRKEEWWSLLKKVNAAWFDWSPP